MISCAPVSHDVAMQGQAVRAPNPCRRYSIRWGRTCFLKIPGVANKSPYLRSALEREVRRPAFRHGACMVTRYSRSASDETRAGGALRSGCRLQRAQHRPERLPPSSLRYRAIPCRASCQGFQCPKIRASHHPIDRCFVHLPWPRPLCGRKWQQLWSADVIFQKVLRCSFSVTGNSGRLLPDVEAQLSREYVELARIEEDELNACDGDQRRELLRLYDHPNAQVRLNAVKATLAVTPEPARRSLRAIPNSREYPQGGRCRNDPHCSRTRDLQARPT